jgi:SAM-dependent methyltransferase
MRNGISVTSGGPSTGCPVCIAGQPAPLGASYETPGRRYGLEQCDNCGCAFTAPRPDDATLRRLYADSYDYRWFRDHYEAKLADARARRAEYGPWLGASVLDFGGGLGYFAAAAREAGLRSETLDPHRGGAVHAPEGGWDSAVALHVLEHSNDPGAMLDEIHGRLRPGGGLILAVPNYASAGYRERGAGWVWAQPPLVHVFHFTARGLGLLLPRHGFEVEAIDYRERWDANYVSDVLEVERFARLEADWARRPWSSFAPYRRYIARRNARLRFEALARSLREHAAEPSLGSELQVRARRRAGA